MAVEIHEQMKCLHEVDPEAVTIHGIEKVDIRKVRIFAKVLTLTGKLMRIRCRTECEIDRVERMGSTARLEAFFCAPREATPQLVVHANNGVVD
jgi:hypothetical protein